MYTGDIVNMKAPNVRGDKVHQKLRDSVAVINSNLAGYHWFVLQITQELY